MTIAIIQFPGSNCERESSLAVTRAGMDAVEFLWNEPISWLKDFEGYFIVGGFSYEDRSRAGVIAAMDPVMKIIQQESDKGKPVLGVCNGAQILVETGIVPGLEDFRPAIALAGNQRIKDGHVLGTGFYNAWVNVQLTGPPHTSAFTRHLKTGQWITIPVAHGEGRFMMFHKLLEILKSNHQTTFRYCDSRGITQPDFPVNPNGSMDNLAGVSNASGNVLALMPHPERSPNGDPIFTSMREYIEEKTKITIHKLSFTPPNSSLLTYQKSEDCLEFLVKLIITDNEAVSVENALRQAGIPVSIKRFVHWEIMTEKLADDRLKKKIIESGELLNTNKETVTVPNFPKNSLSLLVRYKDDIVGQHKLTALKHWFKIDGIQNIKKGTLWIIIPDKGSPQESIQKVLDTHILLNPASHEGFIYSNHHE